MIPPKIMITGTNGFTGRHACNNFSEKGMEVIGIVRREAGLRMNVAVAVCDLTNKDSNGVCGLIARKIVNYERGTDLSPFKLSSLVEERDYLDIRDAVIKRINV